jgi:two-component system, OmpR family, response regulator BaeR
MTESSPSSLPKSGQLVLVVEDESKLASVLTDYLGKAGYRTLVIDNGMKVIGAVRDHAPELILLDLNLPGRDGVDLCREIRSFTETPVVMVTARVEEIDRLLGLEVGADDYICKPFSPREVVARVRTILRRAHAAAHGNEIAGLVLDEQGHRIHFHGKWLDLTAVEFRLLRTLAKAPGRVFTRDQLLNNLYTDNRMVTDRTVDSHIKNLRRKLHEANPEHALVRSVYGVGYKLEA